MAISDDLNSIRTHLEDDYTALEQLGVSVEDRNIENIKDMANQIYAKFPKTDYEEGSNITLSNTLKGKLDFEDGIVGIGDTSQKSYQGYNLAPITDNRYNLDDDNIISISRHDDNNGITYTQFDIRSGETIYLYFIKYNNINNNTSFMGNNDNTNLSFTNIQGLTNNTLYKKTYTATSDITIKITMWGNTNNETLKFQLWATKNEAKNTFEPYVGNSPSPSPSYPQDIEVVTGTQTVYIKDENNNIIDTKTINLGEYEFAKIGNYVDTIEYDVDEDKVYKNKAISKSTLNGTESWDRDGLQSGLSYYSFYTRVLNTLAKAESYLYCNILMNNVNVFSLDVQGITCNWQSAIRLKILNSNITTVAELKTFLANNNLILYYVLKETVKEEITGTLKDQIKALYYSHTFTGTTIIEINGNLPLIIKVRALKGE